jgi:hemin uptake protein HemP
MGVNNPKTQGNIPIKNTLYTCMSRTITKTHIKHAGKPYQWQVIQLCKLILNDEPNLQGFSYV